MINQGTINNSLTRGNKDEIVGWGMPDFSAGVTKSVNTVYQAECDGYLNVLGVQTSQANTSVDLRYSLSSDFSQSITVSKVYTNNLNSTQSAFLTVIPKGIYYKMSNVGTNIVITFYPAKGEINA